MYKSEVLANLALGGLLWAVLARPETITQGLSDCCAVVQAGMYYFGEYVNLQNAINTLSLHSLHQSDWSNAFQASVPIY